MSRADREKGRTQAAKAPARKRPNGAGNKSIGAEISNGANLPRLTYRTARVLSAIAGNPGAANRKIAAVAEVSDEGQVSKLLRRLQREGLAHNSAPYRAGYANAWQLTPKGVELERLGARQLEQLPRRQVRGS
jgi:DNA-binding MarR family transcriptional regulator